MQIIVISDTYLLYLLITNNNDDDDDYVYLSYVAIYPIKCNILIYKKIFFIAKVITMINTHLLFFSFSFPANQTNEEVKGDRSLKT